MNTKSPASLRLPTTRVLVVDDNVANCENLTNQLNQWGLDVSVCLHRSAAVERMMVAQRLEHPFDLVILDSLVPEVNGSDVAFAIRSQPSLIQTPIILLSSDDDLISQHTRAETGIEIALCKPVNPNELIDSIMTLLRRHHLIEEGPNDDSQALISANTISGHEVIIHVSEDRDSSKRVHSVSLLIEEATKLDESELLKPDELMEQCGGDRDFAKQILQIMRETLPNRMLELEGAHCAGDFLRVKHVAHQLTGAAGDCSLNAICKTASALESYADQSDSRLVTSTLTSLRLRIERTLDRLEEFMR